MASEAVLQAIEARRQQIRGQAAWAIKGIESKRDAELAELDFDAGPEEGTAKPASPPAAPKRRQKKESTSPSPAAAKKRREDVHRFIHDQGGEVAPKLVRERLGMSENTFRKAATKLVEEGKLRKEGERQFTRYESIKSPEGAGQSPASAPSPRVGISTLQGRVVMTLQEVEFGTVDELADLLGETTQTITRECGVLIREEEVQMENRSGKTGYVLANP